MLLFRVFFFLLFTFLLSCGSGEDPDTGVTQQGAGDEEQLVVEAGKDITSDENQAIDLMASVIGVNIDSIKWVQLTDANVEISRSTSLTPTIKLPAVDSDLMISLKVTVTNGSKQEASDTIDIFVRNTPTSNNMPPIANAGKDIQLVVGSKATLDASDSKDKDGDIVSYSWTLDGKQLGNEKMQIFHAKAVGQHKLNLSVMDNDGLTGSDILIVNVVQAETPVSLNEFSPELLLTISSARRIVNERLCDDYSSKAVDLQTATLASDGFEVRRPQKEKQLKRFESERNSLDLSLTNINTEIASLEKQITENESELALIEKTRDDLEEIYDTCKRQNSSNSCKKERDNYITERDKSRAIERTKLRPLRNKLTSQKRNQEKTAEELATVNKELSKLTSFFSNAKKARRDHETASKIFSSTFSEIGALTSATLTQTKPFNTLANGTSLVAIIPSMTTSTGNALTINPIGILEVVSGYEGINGGTSLTNIPKVREGDFLPWQQQQENILPEFSKYVKGGISQDINIDYHLACEVEESKIDRSFDNIHFLMTYIFSEKMPIENSYSVSFSADSLREHIQSRAGSLGFVSAASVTELIETKFSDIKIVTTDTQEVSEIEVMKKAFHEDIIRRFFYSNAIPSMSDEISDTCLSDGFDCAVEGWWLRRSSSPYSESDIELPNDIQQRSYDSEVYFIRYGYRSGKLVRPQN